MNDKEGRPLSDEAIRSGKYKLFVGGGGASSGDYTLHYVKDLGMFYVADDTTWPGIALGLVRGADTIAVYLPIGYERLILTTWPTAPGTYVFTEKGMSDALDKPEGMLFYPPKLRAHSLYSLAVLNWNLYRLSLADANNFSWRRGFNRSEALKMPD